MAESDCNNGNQVPESEVTEVVNAWLETIKTPTISGAYFAEDKTFLNITATWVASDVSKKERVNFTKSYGILKTSMYQPGSPPVVHVSSSTPLAAKLTCVSEDGALKAVLVDKNGDDKQKKATEVLQVWDSGSLLKSFDLGEFDKHKFVYTTEAFGATMKWSPDKKRLAYVAEKKVPEGKSFFCVDPKDGKKGEEFALKQSWGEQMTEMKNSVIVVLDVEKGELQVLDLPEDEYPVDVQWVGVDRLVGTVYKIPAWRLGLIYCSNRESAIFSVKVDGSEFKFISDIGRGASSPRVRPDGRYVIWIERPVDRPHQRARSIMGRTLDTPEAPIVLLCESSPPNEIPMYSDLPQRCWRADARKFNFTTPSNGVGILMEGFLTDDGKSATFRPVIQDAPGVDGLLWASGDLLLISRSSCLETPSLELLDISGEDIKRTIVVKGSPVLSPEKFKGSRQLFFGKSSAPSIFIGPECGSVPPNSVPLVVWPHGGPHTVFLDAYTPQIAFLLRIGYAVLQVNYIGSLGSKRDETDDLLGHVGSLDVQDCQDIVNQVLQSVPCLRPDRTFVKGGSHGGFLTCHLTSAFPDVYRAAVARNPVCDLNVMIGTSDITDWQLAECGLVFPDLTKDLVIPAARTEQEAKTYMERSPIINAGKVKAPTLICLGKEDIRVPNSQGLAYYRTLRAHGKIAEVRVYPDCHPLMKLNVLSDVMIHTALWFKRFM